MTETKDKIHETLIIKGRDLVRRKGAEFLTARKLSEATGYSVGTIYNQFANMDKFIMEQNMLTLDELYLVLKKLLPDTNAYKNLNRYIDAFVAFVLSQPNLWFLLYNFHICSKYENFPPIYLRKLLRLTNLWRKEFNAVFAELSPAERKVSLQVLWLSMFSLSSFLTLNGLDKMSKVNKKNICKLLLNTYLAGLSVLNKR